MKQIAIAALLLFTAVVTAQDSGVLGNWKTPTGSVIQIYRCGGDVCAKILEVRKDAPSRVDGKNPDRALRNRPLCGLQIGRNFHLATAGHAEGGQLYDPESGSTYSGWMIRDGNKLKLRGYIGISLFGRTETWTPTTEAIPPCRS